MNNELVDKFVNSDDLPTKMMALEHLCINNYSDLNLLLKQQLELEEEIKKTIMKKIGDAHDPFHRKSSEHGS